jgi:hypothetical protein
MKALLLSLARLLGKLGLGRSYFHVDAGCQIHLTAQAIDATSGAPLDAVEFLLERPWRRTGGCTASACGRPH